MATSSDSRESQIDSFDASPIKIHILQHLTNKDAIERVQKCLDQIEYSTNESLETDKCNRWLSWARSLKDVRVIAAPIPHEILPADLEGVLHDVKVFTKFGPDDKIYDNNEEIRSKIARGNCFFEVTTQSRESTMFALQAMKKFTGGMGDDDDRVSGDEAVWQRYFTKPVENTNRIVCTKKSNGEAAHLSCVAVDYQYIMCGGSKNVHLMFRNRADIKKFTKPRYRIATEICETVMDFLDSMETGDKHRFMKFLVISRLTAVFEILSPLHMHVVDLSSLNKPELKFISWTRTEFDKSADLKHMNIIPPDVGIEIARCLGLDPVEYEVIQMSEFDNKMKEVRQGFNFEGEVLFFLDTDGDVIGLLKKKTTWYIMIRAIREKLKVAAKRSLEKAQSFSKSKSLKQMEERIGQIQLWLKLHDETTQRWKELGARLMNWTLEQLNSGNLSLAEVQDKYPVVWNKFLESCGETDRFEVKLMSS